ncbi:MAG: hypothetical protein KDA86_03055 [Planctomycetaceae bacterium]|nr:hypothetical protein [Planctomycetaceae bacterium]
MVSNPAFLKNMSPLNSLLLAILLIMPLTANLNAEDKPTVRRFHSSRPEGASSVVAVENASLAHSTQLLPGNSPGQTLEEQIQSVLQNLDEVIKSLNATRSDVVKLNVYHSQDLPRETILRSLMDWSPKRESPAVAFVNTKLPNSDAEIGLDAVFVVPAADQPLSVHPMHIDSFGGAKRISHVTVLPQGDVLYISGQAEQGELPTATRETLAGLLRTLEHFGLTRDHIVSLKCFMQPMREVDVVNEQIAEFFGETMIPPVSHVEWISSEKQPIEIELIAWAPYTESEDSVSYYWLPWLPKSPVYCRATRIHSNRRLYTSGLFSEEVGDGEQQVRSIFSQLESILSESGSDMRHLAKATYYVSDSDPSSQLNNLRPEYYDPQRPPAASKAMVTGVGHAKRGITIDMIAAPAD